MRVSTYLCAMFNLKLLFSTTLAFIQAVFESHWQEPSWLGLFQLQEDSNQGG